MIFQGGICFNQASIGKIGTRSRSKGAVVKYAISILLLAIGVALLGAGYSNYSALIARENSWNENQSKFDDSMWKIHDAMGKESQFQHTPKKEFEKTIPAMMLGIGGVSCLLGLFALAIPGSKAATHERKNTSKWRG